MKVSTVIIAAGAGFTLVPATIPSKFVKAEQDGDMPGEPLAVQFLEPDGSYSATVTFPAGSAIRHFREDGPIAKCPGYVAYQTPATGEAYFKVNTPSGNGCTLRLYEYEKIPHGTA